MKNYSYEFSDLEFVNNVHFAYDLGSAKLLFSSEELEHLFEAKPHDLSVAAVIQKIHPEDLPALSANIIQVTEGKFRGSIQFRVLHTAGDRYIRLTPFLAQTRSGNVLLGNVNDVTSEVVHEETVNKYANKKNSILHMLGHDLRGPLNIAKSIVEVVNREAAQENITRKTQSVAAILQDSINLINNLVTREFLETTEIVLFKKRTDIVKKISEYLEEYRRSASINRTFILSSGSPQIYMDVDDAKFMQVINNLMSNSLKFTHPGATIAITITEVSGFVKLGFADNGIGIPEDQLPVIFEKFSRASRQGLNGEPTVGLGLSIVKDIVHWHQGKIWCQSEENKGTTFWIELPKSAKDGS